jgi:hypothetical protein
MAVELNNGIYRRVVFKRRENAWLHRFELVTWPGALCIRGDVGTYVFSRLNDMFEFFRSPMKEGDERLYIDANYWAEKLIASDCNGRRGDGVMRYDSDLFCDYVKRRYVEHVRARMHGKPDERRALRSALEDDVLSMADEGEDAARRAADDFECEGFRLTDFWEVELRDYTTQFIWALYAIAWGIREFDKVQASTDAVAA